MASAVKGVNKTKIDAGGSGSYVIPQGEYAGTVKSCYDSYTSTAIVTGSTISVATPPAGSKIVGLCVTHGALGSGVTLACGDSADADRYFAATSAATAGRIEAVLNTGINYEIGTASGDTAILLTTGGATLTADITVETTVFYV